MGAYPINTTGKQFMFDLDGTVGMYQNSSKGLVSWLSQAQLQNVCTMHNSQGYSVANTTYMTFVFPEPRNITHFSMSHNISNNAITMRVSYDSVDGVGGTWVVARNPADLVKWGSPVSVPGQRAVESFAYNNVRALDIYTTVNTTYYSLNLFGSYASAGLELWHPTLDIPLSVPDLDFEDVQRGNIYTKALRVKNHSSLTANNVAITTATSPVYETLYNNITYSDGGAYANSINIGAIAPSAISGVINIRRTVPANAPQPTVSHARVLATAGSWS